MGRKFFFFFTAFLILLPAIAQGGPRVTVVQGFTLPLYHKAVSGFKASCDPVLNEVTLSNLEGADPIRRIYNHKPEIILSLGIDALIQTKDIRDTPVIYAMSMEPYRIIGNAPNFTGVSINVPFDDQLKALLEVMPEVKNIGLIYDPDRTGYLVKAAKTGAKKNNINLITREITHPKHFFSALDEIRGQLDLVWMFPDATSLTSETFEIMLLVSLEDDLPILTFSPKYLGLGAMISVGVDPYDIGAQAADLAKKIYLGAKPADLEVLIPRKTLVTVNLRIAEKLGVHFSEKSLSKAEIFNNNIKQ